MAGDVLYIGIDLGTFRSVMVSSDSHEEEELTVIGTPKDPIAKNFLKRDVLFGEEALKNPETRQKIVDHVKKDPAKALKLAKTLSKTLSK